MENRNFEDLRLAQHGVLWLAGVLLVNVFSVFYYLYFLRTNGYLPSPFFYDKSDTLTGC